MTTQNNDPNLNLYERAVSSTSNPEISEILRSYLNSTHDPTLSDFLAKNIMHLASAPTRDIKQYWTGRYKSETADLNMKFELGNPDWYAILLKVHSNTVSLTTSGSHSTVTPSKSLSSLEQMKQVYARVTHGDKWTLPSGVVVEDQMLKFAETVNGEHAVHSFIPDINDECWKNYFDHTDLAYIKTYQIPTLPELNNERVEEYINSFEGKKTYEDIMSHLTRFAPYTKNEDPEVTWLRYSISSHMMNFLPGTNISDLSESDLVHRIWSPLRYVCDGTQINTATEKESTASSNGKNAARSLGKRKSHGVRPDIRFVYDNNEIGCGEAGKVDGGEYGTKEMQESHLKCPRMLRDMLAELAKKHPDDLRQLRTFGIIMSGNTGSWLVMDSPGGIVGRLSRSRRATFTTDVTAYVRKSLPILKSFLRFKRSMLEVVEVLRNSEAQEIDLTQVTAGPLPYSVSTLSSPKSTQSSSESGSSTGRSPSSTSKRQRQK
ncbi:hypothetical protein BJV82DRAFT_589382 [Fennellomyces sp. T-0311]|nr:hypothetical protein BJV82DRAFT_589382 [Fennellomyces sp. T-0311]